MSSLQIEPPPAPGAPPARAPRRGTDPERRSIQVGVTATIVFHLLLLLLGPRLFEVELVHLSPEREKESEPFMIELEPEPPAAAPLNEAPPPSQFVETNPNVPDNPPDETNNFGAQNQQVAQETPTPDGKSDRPAIEGEKDINSTQIVSGNLSQPQLPPPSLQAPTPQQAAVQQEAGPRQREAPLQGFEKMTGDDPAGIGSNVARISENTKAGPEEKEGADQPQPERPLVAQIPIDRFNPQPRPAVALNARPAVFQDNPIGTANFGPIAVDAKWSNYGQYLQRLIEAVDQRWNRLVSDSRFYPTQGSRVTVRFVLNKEGRIASIVSVDGNAGDLATSWCVAGISPSIEGFTYGVWTEDMIAILGDRQELTFTFLYR